MEELLIFVGHSDDAKEEASAVSQLQQALQDTLRRLNKVASARSKYATLRIFDWVNDANLGVGGQNFAIAPELKQAAIAIFVFKERIGRGTWGELETCRERKQGERIPVIALFPKNLPHPDRMNITEVANDWVDLLKKQRELTADWDKTNSRSITPVEQYTDCNHLKQILMKRLEEELARILAAEHKSDARTNADQHLPHLKPTILDYITEQTEYDPQAVQKYRSLMRTEIRSAFPLELSDAEFLSKAGYTRGGKLTVIGALLFTNQPGKIIPSAMIRCTKYTGLDKTTERSRKNCDGSLFNQIFEARDFIVENTKSREKPIESSMQSRTVYQYPMVCVREVLANAVCHRNYEDSDRLIYVTIYTDRIEIKNPGSWTGSTLAEGQTIPLHELASESVQCNMRLAHAIAAINMMEMEGSGIPSSIRDCEEQGAPEPVVEQRDGYVIVTIYPKQDWDDTSKQVIEKVSDFNSEDSSIPPISLIPRPPIVGFVARRDEQGREILARLKEELAPEKGQLVVLSGLGGAGKTTLAAEAARSLSPTFEGRVVWVRAIGREDFTLLTLLDEILIQLGRTDLCPLPPVQKEAQTSALVSAQPTLVVLDNFETISPTEQARCVEFLLERASCPALITTRQRIYGGRNIIIPAMSREEADKYLRLLMEQAENPTAFDGLDPERIMQVSERNPLVLQWLVAQINLAQEAETVLNELLQGESDAAERVFDRSFNLEQVGEDGRDVLLALSLFVPDAARGMLAEVAGFGANQDRLNAAVRNLAALFLVKPAPKGRLAVEGLTRELARARLQRDARYGEFCQRFADTLHHYAEAHSQPTPEDYNALEAELDNLLAAMDVAFIFKAWQYVCNFAIFLASPVVGVLYVRGYWEEALRRNDQALAAARNSTSEHYVACLAHNAAVIHQERGEVEEAKRLYNESLEIAQKLNDQSTIANTLYQLGRLDQLQGNLQEARQLYNESLEIKKKIGDRTGIAVSLHNLGQLAQLQGNFKEARQLYNESLEINKTLGNQSGIATSLHQLGILAQKEGKLEEARKLYNESLEIARKLGDQSGIANSLGQLGALAEQEGDKSEAARLYREAVAIFERLGSPYAEQARRALERVEEESS